MIRLKPETSVKSKLAAAKRKPPAIPAGKSIALTKTVVEKVMYPETSAKLSVLVRLTAGLLERLDRAQEKGKHRSRNAAIVAILDEGAPK